LFQLSTSATGVTKYATSVFKSNSLRGIVIEQAQQTELDSIIRQFENSERGMTLGELNDTVNLVEMKTLFSSWKKDSSFAIQSLPSSRIAFLKKSRQSTQQHPGNLGLVALQQLADHFTICELKTAGFLISELKLVGFSALQLKTAPFAAAELKAAGFPCADVRAAGYTAAEMKAGGYQLAEMKAGGFICRDLGTRRSGGFTVKELVDAGFPEVDALNADQLAVQQAQELVRAGATFGKFSRAKLQSKTNHDPVRKRFRVENKLLCWYSWKYSNDQFLIDRAQVGECTFCQRLANHVHVACFSNQSRSFIGPSPLLRGSGIVIDPSLCFCVFFVVNPRPAPTQGVVTSDNFQLDLVASSQSEAESWVRGIQAIVGKL
jgi:hypothetical protein